MRPQFVLSRWIDWRDPVVASLGVLFVVNLALLSSAIQDGAAARVSISLGVCYGLVVAMIGISRRLTGHDALSLAFSGGIACFAALAFVTASTAEYAAVAVAFGACSLYYCWRLVRASA